MKRRAWLYVPPSAMIAIGLALSGCRDQHAETSGASTSGNGAPPMRVDSAYGADSVPIYYEVHGQGDTALVLVHGWGIHGGLASFDVAVVDEVGHFPFLEKPSVFNHELSTMLTELRATGAAH